MATQTLGAFASALDDIATTNRAFDKAAKHASNYRNGTPETRAAGTQAVNEARENSELAWKALKAATPDGLELRPTQAALALNVSKAGDSHSMALFYLNAGGKRARNPELTRVAWEAIKAMGQAVAPQGFTDGEREALDRLDGSRPI